MKETKEYLNFKKKSRRNALLFVVAIVLYILITKLIFKTDPIKIGENLGTLLVILIAMFPGYLLGSSIVKKITERRK